MTSPDIFVEDLQWQAKRALELGRSLCSCPRRDHWSYALLRAAGITSSVSADEHVLAPLMLPFMGDRPRVMIGGSADLGLFCLVGRCTAARHPQITVIDKCRAPLALIEEFAASRGIECRALQADLLALDGRERWDVILLHNTLEFFVAPSRAQFFNAIATSLAPGGGLVCVAITGRKLAPERQKELESEFRIHSMTALRRSSVAALERGAELEALIDDYAKGYATRRMGYPDDDELYDLFRQARLEIVSEYPMPKKWTFSKVDSAPESLRKLIIIATRD